MMWFPSFICSCNHLRKFGQGRKPQTFLGIPMFWQSSVVSCKGSYIHVYSGVF